MTRWITLSIVAMLSLVVAFASAGQKRAFVDPVTGVLKAVGYVDRNEPGDLAIDIPEDFDPGPLSWRWTGSGWERISPILSREDVQRDAFRAHVNAILADPTIPPKIKDVLNAIKDRLR